MFIKIIKLNIFLLLIFKLSFAEIISDIKVEGNKRISVKTIKIFSEVTVGKNYNDNELNTILKKLYETNFFDLVELRTNKNTLLIKVVENPLIEDVQINGLRSKDLIEKIKDLMELRSRKSYLESIAISDLKRVKTLLRRNGYYFAKIESDIEW